MVHAPSPTQEHHEQSVSHTPGPWEYVASTEHHGPYVTTGGSGFGDIADCYAMTDPTALSVRNGGSSRPVHHQGDSADANARLISAAPDLLAALKGAIGALEFSRDYHKDLGNEDQAFAQDKLDAAIAAIAKAEGRQ